MTEAMPFLRKCDITFLRPPTIRRGVFSCQPYCSVMYRLARDWMRRAASPAVPSPRSSFLEKSF